VLPPTASVTCRFSTAWPCAVPVSASASAKVASAAWAVFIASSRRWQVSRLIGCLIRREGSRGKAPARDLCARFGRRRPPDQEPALDQRDEKVDADHKRGEYEHAGEHAGDVEHAFGLLDDVAESSSRAEILADHGAHHGEAD